MPRQLSGLDAAFLEMETDRAFMHGVGIVRLAPSDEPLTLEQLTEHLGRRLGRLEPLRQRLVSVPAGVDHPWWIDVVPDPAEHLERVVLEGPDRRQALEAVCAAVARTPLERDRPLWRGYLVDGLDDGGQALLLKMHHSLFDGVGGLVVVSGLLDTEPEPPDGPDDAPGHPEPEPSIPWLLARAAVRVARLPIDVVRTGVEVGTSVLRIARLGRQPHPDMAVPLAAPSLAMGGTVSAGRDVALRDISLARVKQVARAEGVHVNDVVLATVAGGLRTWLDDHGDLPDQALVAAVPVSLRTADQLTQAGNLVSAAFVHLATDIAHPVERLRAAAESATGGKAAHVAFGGHTLEHLLAVVYPQLLTSGMRLYSALGMARIHPPAVNVVVSNVAGPSWPYFLHGHRVTSLTALGPIFDSVPLNLTVVSYEDDLSLAYLACPECVTDLAGLADATVAAFEELAASVDSAG